MDGIDDLTFVPVWGLVSDALGALSLVVLLLAALALPALV